MYFYLALILPLKGVGIYFHTAVDVSFVGLPVLFLFCMLETGKRTFHTNRSRNLGIFIELPLKKKVTQVDIAPLFKSSYLFHLSECLLFAQAHFKEECHCFFWGVSLVTQLFPLRALRSALKGNGTPWPLVQWQKSRRIFQATDRPIPFVFFQDIRH